MSYLVFEVLMLVLSVKVYRYNNAIFVCHSVSRMGSRSNWGIVARSEAEFNEIVDNLNEQEVWTRW